MEGNIVVEHDVPAQYATSFSVKEGAIDSRKVTVVEHTYKQSDIVKMLLQTYAAECEAGGQ